MCEPRNPGTLCPLSGNSTCWIMKDHMEESPAVSGDAILDQPIARKPQNIKRAQPRSAVKILIHKVHQVQLKSTDHPWDIKIVSDVVLTHQALQGLFHSDSNHYTLFPDLECQFLNLPTKTLFNQKVFMLSYLYKILLNQKVLRP